jgi:hypothetical protein
MTTTREEIFSKYLKSLREEKKQLGFWLAQVKSRLERSDIPNFLGVGEDKGDEGHEGGDEEEEAKNYDMMGEELKKIEEEEIEETAGRYEGKIRTLDERLMCASKEEGEDEHFEAYFSKAMRAMQRRQTKEIRKKLESDKHEEENKIKGQQMFEEDRKQRYQDRHLESVTRRELDYFLKMDDSIPDYMQRNLNSMSNNRGYVWRGVHYYGSRSIGTQEDFSTSFIQERRKGQNYVIEDTYHKVKRTFLKPNKAERELVEELYWYD